MKEKTYSFSFPLHTSNVSYNKCIGQQAARINGKQMTTWNLHRTWTRRNLQLRQSGAKASTLTSTCKFCGASCIIPNVLPRPSHHHLQIADRAVTVHPQQNESTAYGMKRKTAYGGRAQGSCPMRPHCHAKSISNRRTKTAPRAKIQVFWTPDSSSRSCKIVHAQKRLGKR